MIYLNIEFLIFMIYFNIEFLIFMISFNIESGNKVKQMLDLHFTQSRKEYPVHRPERLKVNSNMYSGTSSKDKSKTIL